MLPIRFNLSGVSRTRAVADIRVNTKDEYRNLVYLAKPLGHQVPISYVGMPEPTAADIRITDINEIPGEMSVTENSFRARVRRVTEDKIFTLPTRSANITDVTNTDSSGRLIPLWYKHAIPDGMETSPQILDQEMRPVRGQHYKVLIEGDQPAVYHDLFPSVDSENLRTEAYYIRYTNTAGEQVFSLLNSDPVYRRVVIGDVINPNRRQMTVRRLGEDFQYRILYVGNGPFFMQIGVRDQIKLRKPVVVKPNDAWHLEVTDGELFGRSEGAAEWYSVPEYHFQQYTPVEPVRTTGTRECSLLTNNIVKVPVEGLLSDQAHQIEILITDEKMRARAAFTSGPTSPTPYWVDRFERIVPEGHIVRHPMKSMQQRGISVHKAFGLIHFPFEIPDKDRVFVRASYTNLSYTYLGLNLNPLHSRNMIGGRAIVYCRPESEIDENNRAIHHIILNEANDIIAWNDERLGLGGVLDPSLVPGVGETGYQLFRQEFPKSLLLGTVAINRSVNPADLSYIDVRERGGVLTDETRRNLIPLLETYPELQWVEDESLHGRAFPAHGAFIVDIPFAVLEEAGGDFTHEDVVAAIRKHMALGGYPSIRYYADTPEVLTAEYNSDTGTLSVTWRAVEHADSYRIYISASPGEGYLPVEATDTVGSLTNSRTASIEVSPVPQDNLYLYVAPMRSRVEWPAGKVAGLTMNVFGDIARISIDAILAAPPSASTELDAILVEE